MLAPVQTGNSQKLLKEVFDYYGKVAEVTVPKNKATNSTKGFAFVLYANGQSADKCTPPPFTVSKILPDHPSSSHFPITSTSTILCPDLT